MLHKQVASDHLAVSLSHQSYAFGALLAHLTIQSAKGVIVTQANMPLRLRHHSDTFERDIALVRDEPLFIASEDASLWLLYSGNGFVRIIGHRDATLVTDGIEVIEEEEGKENDQQY